MGVLGITTNTLSSNPRSTSHCQPRGATGGRRPVAELHFLGASHSNSSIPRCQTANHPITCPPTEINAPPCSPHPQIEGGSRAGGGRGRLRHPRSRRPARRRAPSSSPTAQRPAPPERTGERKRFYCRYWRWPKTRHVARPCVILNQS